MKRRNTLKRRKMKGGKSLKRYVGGEGKGNKVFGHMSFDQILELAFANKSQFEKNGSYFAKCIPAQTKDKKTLAFALIIIPINSEGQGSKIICFSSSDLWKTMQGYLKPWPGNKETWAKFNDSHDPEVRCREATETFLKKITRDDILNTLLTEISKNWSTNILIFDGNLSLSDKCDIFFGEEKEELQKELIETKKELERSLEDQKMLADLKEKSLEFLERENETLKSQVQALESRVQDQAPVHTQVRALDQLHSSHVGLRDQAPVHTQVRALDQLHSSHVGLRDQAPPYLIERILKNYKEERKYIELSLRLLHLSGEKLRGTQIIQKMQISAHENLDWGKKPWMFTSAQIKYIWGLIMFGYGLYSTIIMDNDTQYADNIGELREIYTLTGMIPTTVESLLSFDKVREYYKDKPPFKPIILNYIVEEPITGGPGKDASLISYMKETAKLYDLKELSVYRYNQTTSDSFLEMMKSYENDSVLPLRYSYVNIHNKNNGPLYIFILNPLLGKSEEITTEYYESVVFQLICILEPSEEKHFMFPMNTNLLFWCSDIDKKKEKEEVDEDEGASDIARTPGVLPPDASLSQSYTLPTYYGAPQQSESGSPQKPWGKDDFVDPPSKSFIEKVKEFFSDYKTDPKLIPPINENFYSNKQGGEIYMRSVNYQGFNSEGWRSETFKSCKIEEINATVNVSR